MSSSLSSSIKEEITELSNALVLAQSRLLQLAKRVEQQDQETENWKSRYADIEVAYKEALTSAKWLRVQNVELERKMANHKPEVNNVLSAREDAFQKLKHARKVIRDLLDERGDMKNPIRQEDIDQALFGEFQPESPPSTDSSKTVRLATALQISTNASTSQLSQEGQEPGSHRALTSRSASEDSLNVESEHSASPLSPPASQISTQTSEEHPQKTSRGPQWRIHFKKPPGTSVMIDGPLSLSILENDLSMDDYMVFSLQRLAVSSEFGMRFQILRLHSEKNVACLYDPIFIETPKKSYILDWGHRQTNEDMRKYIMGHKDIDPVFHTFTFPLQKQDGWFYIGAQHWSVVDFETIWPLDGKSRTSIIKKLVKRSKGNETEIAGLLDSGELVQFCVELTAVADTSVSQDFSQDVLGYRTTC